MARIIKSGSGTSPEQWFSGIVKNVDKGAEEGLKDVSKTGEDLIRNFIYSRPARTSGPSGRYKTGDMSNAVSSRSEARKSNFGWINDVKPYYLFQEGGFTHVGSGEWIKGMYAVTDSADITFEQFKSHMDEVVKNA